MRSFLAALRTLVLPYGATTGSRIVLDGVLGQILIYDASGALAADIIPGFGFEVWDPSGNLRLRLSSPLAGQYSALQMWTGVLEETNQSLYTLADFGPMNRLVITPGEQSSKGGMEWTICSAPWDDSIGAMLQAVCLTLNDAGNLRPTVDLTGAAAPSESVQPHTVMYRGFVGTPNSFGQEPTKVGELIRAHSTVDTPKLQAGIKAIAAVAGTSSGSAAVTFDDPFTNIPSITLALRSSGARPIIVEARNATVNGFDAFWRTADGATIASNVTWNVNWMAFETAPIP